MTRAGEKLYDGWEARNPVPWRRWATNVLLLALFIGIASAALFGFG